MARILMQVLLLFIIIATSSSTLSKKDKKAKAKVKSTNKYIEEVCCKYELALRMHVFNQSFVALH